MKHWTLKKPTKVKSMYSQTVGNPYLRSVAVERLYSDLVQAKSSGHKKYITSDLLALGQGDYLEADHGEAPKGAE